MLRNYLKIHLRSQRKALKDRKEGVCTQSFRSQSQRIISARQRRTFIRQSRVAAKAAPSPPVTVNSNTKFLKNSKFQGSQKRPVKGSIFCHTQHRATIRQAHLLVKGLMFIFNNQKELLIKLSRIVQRSTNTLNNSVVRKNKS